MVADVPNEEQGTISSGTGFHNPDKQDDFKKVGGLHMTGIRPSKLR